MRATVDDVPATPYTYPMDIVANELLASWDRQSQILLNTLGLVTTDLLDAKPSEDGGTIAEQFSHIHGCRKFWVSKVAPGREVGIDDLEEKVEGEWITEKDLDIIRLQLVASSAAVRAAVADALEAGTTQFGPYSHPVQFLQHMLWHEGYHYALVALALRLAGHEPTQAWEEANVWGLWRDSKSV